MEGPNPWLAFWGPLMVAVVALIVAGITLSKVLQQVEIANRQIALANQQITLANNQIDVAKRQLDLAAEELSAVRADLQIATEMKALAQREPRLSLKYKATSTQHTQFGVFAHSEFILDIAISNEGQRIANDVYCEILFARHDLTRPEDITATRIVDGLNYALLRFPSGGFQRIPIGNNYRDGVYVRLDPSVREVEFLWRIFDDAFAYPLDDWGRERVPT